MVLTIVVVVVVVLLVGFVIVGFNKLRRSDIEAQEALGGIDVQLTRRADLIPNLVNTVKGYASHEKTVFEDVTAARSAVSSATKGGSVDEKAQAQAQLDRAVFNVMAVAENYPELKASSNFLQLQNQLTDTENQLSFARQFYNDAVARLNKMVQTIPWMFLAGVASVTKRDFYRAPEGQAAPPTVSF